MTDKIKYASKGEIVTCENGHKIAVFNKDVYDDDITDPKALDWDFEEKMPGMGEEFKKCKCGAFYVRSPFSLHINGKWHY